MGTLFTVLLKILAIIGVCFIYILVLGYDNFGGITLQLDDYYTNANDMASGALAELRKQGRQCEIIGTKTGELPKFLVDGKKYVMVYKMASAAGVPVQTIQLKRIRH